MKVEKKEYGYKWNLGTVHIHQIIEIDAGKLIQEIIPDATPDNIKNIPWLIPHFANDDGTLNAQVQGFLIESESNLIIIDTCIGSEKERKETEDWNMLQSQFIEHLRQTGHHEDDVTHVACTHLHFDHVGWNTKKVNGAWVPTFKNAKYIFSKNEFEYWNSNPQNEIEDDRAGFEDSILPIIESNLQELVEDNHIIDNHVSFVPSPGHTPHHCCILIQIENESILISGDFLHHPCQIAHPHWSTLADSDKDKAIQTRLELFNKLSKQNTYILGSHFADPVCGKIIKHSSKFHFEILK